MGAHPKYLRPKCGESWCNQLSYPQSQVSLSDRFGIIDLEPTFFHLGPSTPQVSWIERDFEPGK